MVTSEEFEQELREALARLYDPNYQPSEAFCSLIGCNLRGGSLAVQATMVRAVESLEPPSGTPYAAQTRRVYDVLHSRFVLKLTQEETAERLHISLSSVQRAQREAVHTLARVLWECSRAQEPPMEGRAQGSGAQPSEEEALGTRAPDWRTQMKQEVASLRSRDPNSVADVAETLQGVLELESALAPGRDVHVEVGYVQPDLVVAVHPSALRQTLIAALGRLARHASSGPITAFARLREGDVRITIRGSITAEHGLTEGDLTRDILVPEGTTVEAGIQGDYAFLWINVPSLGQICVLVVDDNPDMLQFYRRCTTGTRYRIVHASTGQEALERIRIFSPDIVVLDVMLPDVDGWKLLMQLYEDPATRSIPIIVCSVVREGDLARALGAAVYLPKPVEPRQFVEALDQVRPQASAGALEVPANSATTD